MKFYYHNNLKATWQKPGPGEQHGHWVAPLVFECEAQDIQDADKQFEAKIGKSPAKMPYIGCSWKHE